MKSKTLIGKQLKKKTNSELVETIIAAKKNKNWKRVAEVLSGPRRKRKNINLLELNSRIEKEKNIIVPGKILSLGEIDKKIKISAIGFSEKAKEKLLKAGCDIKTILEEIKSNPEAKEVKILE